METNVLILAAVLVVVVLLGIIGVLSRYRKCKSDEVLVVYGKTGGTKSAKLYHGGAAFRVAYHSGLRLPFDEADADRL